MKACKHFAAAAICIVIVTGAVGLLLGQASGPPPINPNDPKGLELGSGVPRVLDTNGNVVGIDLSFTTKQYQDAAINLMVQEANRVASQMHLLENFPITISNIVSAYVGPFGYNYKYNSIGSVSTTNYTYFMTGDDKFNQVVVADYAAKCFSLEATKLPISEIDTNMAYELATQFLKAASMDVSRLNKDFECHVALSPGWNSFGRLGQRPKVSFVPIYYVWWTGSAEDVRKYGGLAEVELYLPTRRLLQLRVGDPRYILRKPLTFTNLAALFPGRGRIWIFTNYSIYASPSRNESP